jgi:tetratricopeptide (TPR) repeat protein
MAMYNHVAFGEVLKTLRTRKRLSRRIIAERIGKSASALEKWEQGYVLPDRARIDELIYALELTADEELLLLEAHAGHRILPSSHNLPALQNPYFTGRETILAQLHKCLAPGSQVALTQTPQAVSGLGGIGKTQVALYYAYCFQKAYSHILWVAADSQEMLTSEFTRLAQDLDLPEKDEQDQGKIVQAVQRWLREYLNWLLIFDNIEDLGLINKFVPSGHLGAVLLTTRRQVTEPVAQALELDVFSEDEGALFLLKRTKRLALHESLDKANASDVTIAQTITQQLGGLPLGLDQAGAYIVESRCSLSDYLDLFQQRRTVLLQRRGTVATDHPQSVMTTFSLAFEQIQQKNEAAIELLKLCAFLAPDMIPLEVIVEGCARLDHILEPLAVDVIQLDQVLETLQAYSLLQRDGENQALSIHRLVQAVLLDTLSANERKEWQNRIIKILAEIFPERVIDTLTTCARLLPHVLIGISWIEHEVRPMRVATLLLHRTGTYLTERGQYAEAEPLLLRALTSREQQLGPQHPDTAMTLHYLAKLYQNQGKYEQAEPLLLRSLAIREQQLGPQHPDTVMTINNLATIYGAQGNYEQAEPLLLRALTSREQQLGPQHPDTAMTLTNLAYTYIAQGKYTQAEPLCRRSLAICEQQLGPDHYGTAMNLHNLTWLYIMQGRYTQAEPLCRRSLAICEQQLGSGHPETATRLNNLAIIQREQGNYELLFLSALGIQEHILVPNHPDLAETLHEFAVLRQNQNNGDEALSLYQRALVARTQALGTTHPVTISTRERLTTLLSSMGRTEEVTALESKSQN